VYRFLDHPFLYRLTQKIAAPGAATIMARHIRRLLTELPPAERLLDVGCGPRSLLFGTGRYPLGVDCSHSYLRAYAAEGGQAVCASADALPFCTGAFDGIWSIGLLHHLPDATASSALYEMLRVCRDGGYVVILDAVLPVRAWTRPLAAAIRRLDRGKSMRTQAQFRALLPDAEGFQLKRITYTLTGCELLIACRQTSR
jgi:SAM-dependent methyltransferase